MRSLFPGQNAILTHVLFLTVVLFFSYHFTRLHFSLSYFNKAASLAALLNNTAEVPFQYRMLVPCLAKSIFQIPFAASLFEKPLNVFFFLEMMSLFFLVISLRSLSAPFIRNVSLRSLFALSIFFVLPFNYLLPRNAPFWYPSDVPAILFFTLGLICLYKERWLLYYIIFSVGTLNRETTCFLTFIYLFTALSRKPVNRILLHCCAQCVIWFSIKYLLSSLYADNPGSGFFQPHLRGNIRLLADPKIYPFLCSSFGFLWIPVWVGFNLISVDFIRRSLFVVFPFMAGMLLVGNIHELRIYGELSPLILIALLLIIRELFKREFSTGID